MVDYGNKVRLAHYDASDGPKLMMFGPLHVDLPSLQKLFRYLAAKPGTSIQLGEQPFVVALAKVRLICTDLKPVGALNQHAGLRRLHGVQGMAFEWGLNSEGWDDLAVLMDALVKSPNAGHQYLTTYPVEDAIAVVSKGEYADEVLGL